MQAGILVLAGEDAITSLKDLQIISNYKDMKQSVWGNAIIINDP